MFAVMRETEYATKQVFLTNFWEDWRVLLGPRHTIRRVSTAATSPYLGVAQPGEGEGKSR